MNLITLFVLSTEHQRVLHLLQQFSGIHTAHTAVMEVETVPQVLSDPTLSPTSYSLFGNGPWTIIEINSVLHLHNLAQHLSGMLATPFLQIIYCEIIEYAYLLYYDQGKLIREIEARRHQQNPDLNVGQPFDFEELPLEYFDLDMLAFYCQQWNIDLSNLYTSTTCTVLEQISQLPLICMDHRQAIEKLLPSGPSTDAHQP